IEHTVVTYGKPGTPSLTASRNGTQLQASWTEPDTGGSTLTYTVRWSDGATTTTASRSITRSAGGPGNYSFAVTACSNQRAGLCCDDASGNVVTVPSASGTLSKGAIQTNDYCTNA